MVVVSVICGSDSGQGNIFERGFWPVMEMMIYVGGTLAGSSVFL